MSINDKRKLKAIKTLIIPKLPPNFHESLFFSEIQYQIYPSKHLRKYLINLYIQGIDYYSTEKQKDLSLYFQTKLLNLLKGVDYFEKITSKQFDEKNIDTIIESRKSQFLIQKQSIDNNTNKNVEEELKGQQEQFLKKLNMKKKLKRFQRLNSVNPLRKSAKNKLAFNIKKSIDSQFAKRVSIDLSSSFFPQEKDKNKVGNNIFSKVEKALNGFDKINTLLIIEYSKKLKKYMKKELQSMNERIDKYNEYIKSKNQLNLIYEEIEDKNGDEAKALKEQIDIYKKEWDEFNKKNLGENDKYGDIVKLESKNIDDLVDNLFNKIEEINLNKNNL